MNEISRRSFIRHAVELSALGIGAGLVLTACGKGGAGSAATGCNDTTGLDDAAKGFRTSNNYMEASTDPAKTCETCQLWVVPAAGAACGGCSVIKGPINAKGTCNLYAKKV